MSIEFYSFGINTVYAPNVVVEIYCGLNALATWIMCRDFNMVEVASNKEGLLPFYWIDGK